MKTWGCKYPQNSYVFLEKYSLILAHLNNFWNNMRPLKVIFPNMDMRLLCTWIVFRPSPHLERVNLVLNLCMWVDYPKDYSEQNCIHDFCRAKCLLACDSQHFKAYEAQLPLPTPQANELPTPGSQSWGSRAEAFSSHSLMKSHGMQGLCPTS